MRTRRLLGAAALSTLVAVGLTGCMKIDLSLDLQSDDTVDGSMVFAISTELAELAGESPESLAEQMQQEMVDVGEEGATRTEPYDDGEFIGTTTYFEGEALDSFGTPGEAESLSIVRDGDDYVVSGVLDLSDADAEGGEMVAGLMEGFEIQIAISFPGAVSDHNGQLDGKTVTWSPTYGERLDISARGSAIESGGGSDGVPVLLIVGIVVLALLLIGLILFFVLRSRKGDAEPAMPTGYPAPPVDGQSSWTPPPAPPTATPPYGQAPPTPPATPAAQPLYEQAPPIPPVPPSPYEQDPPAPPAASPPQGQTPPPPPAP